MPFGGVDAAGEVAAGQAAIEMRVEVVGLADGERAGRSGAEQPGDLGAAALAAGQAPDALADAGGRPLGFGEGAVSDRLADAGERLRGRGAAAFARHLGDRLERPHHHQGLDIPAAHAQDVGARRLGAPLGPRSAGLGSRRRVGHAAVAQFLPSDLGAG
jgi:hypothetical protein